MAKVPKSGLREVHIDIGSHNENPGRPKKTGSIGGGYFVKKMGMDSNGNHAVWVSVGDGRARKIQTNYNLPITHRERELTTEVRQEILDYVGGYGSNPAPRIGTARPRRVSQITKKAPSRRLIARRSANTRKGYFPNPTAGVGDGVKLLHEIQLALQAAATPTKFADRRENMLAKQARISYAQGLVQAAYLMKVINHATYKADNQTLSDLL